MSSRPTTRPVATQTRAVPRTAALDPADQRDQGVVEQREGFRTRHTRALTGLMSERDDLRGIHALADLVDDAVRWSA